MNTIETEPARKTQAEQFSELVDSALAQREGAVVQDVMEVLREAAKPREDRRLSIADPASTEPGTDPEQAAVERLRPIPQRAASHPLYRTLGEEEQEWRNPDSDHWMQRWLIGLAHKREDWRLEAAAKLEAMFGRATWEVGDSTSGGVPDGTAGDLVPIPLLNVVMINRDRVAKVPMLSTAFQIPSIAARIPRVGQATVAMVAEGATAAQGEPPVDGIFPRANKMQGKAAITEEQLADSAFNSVSLIAARMGTAMGQEEDVQACTTNGTAPNISENIHTGLTPVNIGGAPTYDDIVALYFAVAQIYRMDAVWFGNSAALESLTKIRDSANYPIFSMQATVPGAITDDSADGVVFRKPVYEVPSVSATTTNGNGRLYFGSRSRYGWGRRGGMTARASEHALFESDSWMYKFTQRVEGIVLDPGGAGNASAAVRDDIA